jgi:hypothetical protein
MKHTLVGKLEDVVLEDGGRAKIGTLYSESGDIFLRVQSWVDEADGEHKSFDDLQGKTLRVTIEVIEDCLENT